MNTNPSDILELISRGDAEPMTSAERDVIAQAIAVALILLFVLLRSRGGA